MNIDLTPLLQAIIGILAVIITKYLIPYIKSKTTAEEQAEIAEWISIAVTAAEQIYTGSGKGAEKKAYVIEFLQSKGYTAAVNVISDELNALIEAAVYGLKN